MRNVLTCWLRRERQTKDVLAFGKLMVGTPLLEMPTGFHLQHNFPLAARVTRIFHRALVLFHFLWHRLPSKGLSKGSCFFCVERQIVTGIVAAYICTLCAPLKLLAPLVTRDRPVFVLRKQLQLLSPFVKSVIALRKNNLASQLLLF